jgi:hypothetical protein
MISGQLLASFVIDPVSGRVVLEMDGQGDLVLGKRTDLAAARAYMDFVLDSFRGTFTSERPSLAELATALRELDEQMFQIGLTLVGDSVDLFDEIRERFIRAWPQWQVATDVVPIIEVRGHDDDFPFELLPMFDATPIGDLYNLVEAEMAVRRFVGFGAVVRRTTGETVEVSGLQAEPAMPLQLLTYEMAGASAEVDHLSRRLGQIEMDGPWPGPELTDEEVRELLIDALFDPSTSLDGRHRTGIPIQVQHFACHCATENQTDVGYTIILGGPDDRRRAISLGAIRQGFRQRAQARGRGLGARPLVVVNACGSARIDKGTRRSFQQWFLNNRHRGYVGTETDIPDVVAAAFAERLYDALLAGRPLGEAIVIARRRLLNEWGNPLGLLYVLYGDPALAIEK